MILAWQHYWPAVAAALLIGVFTGAKLFAPFATGAGGGLAGEASATADARRRRRRWLAGGLLLTLAVTALWHGPAGAAERFATRVESFVRTDLTYLEMTQVRARLARGPLARRVELTGPADDFQRPELARILAELPGVSSARWTDSGSRGFAVPLLAEVCVASLLGFLLGLLLAYLVEIRRRSNAEWRW